MKRHIKNYFNGLAFGVTETVPGVSAGTVAIILGYYFELIEAINHFGEDKRKYLRFLVPLVLGIATGMVAGLSVMHHLLTRFSLPTMCFFVGLIVGLVPLIFDKVAAPNNQKPHRWTLTALPLIAFVVVANLRQMPDPDPMAVVAGIDLAYMLFLLVSGMVAAAALVIPGISGSFVLLLVGVYPVVTYTMATAVTWLTHDIGNFALLADIGRVVLPLGLGIVIGGLSMARLIEKLLKNYHTVIYSIILGLLLGSVYYLFQQPDMYKSYENDIPALVIVISAVTGLCGCAVSYTLGKKRL
jgi:putative membrane protein